MKILKCISAMSLMLAHAQIVFASVVSTEVLPLSGMGASGEKPVHWDFQLDKGRGSGKWARILVPSCWEQQGFGSYYYGGQGRHKPDEDPIIPKEVGTYRRDFQVPAHWDGRAIHLIFEGVMTDATVSINGVQAGPAHQGGFYRFEYDVSKLIKAGRNEIKVLVSKESANKSVNFAERRGDYWTFGGIFRPVWLEARPLNHIAWTAIDARADGTFYARVHLGREAPPAARVLAVIQDRAGRVVAEIEAKRLNGDTAIVNGKVESPSLWTAETPNLYTAKFSLFAENQKVHELPQRFGFRTIEVRPRDGVYLNGSKIVLKGINRHSFRAESGRTLSRDENYADARLIKQANMNAVRMSHYPPDSSFLEAADELGLYVLDELAGWQGYYDTSTGARLIGQIVRRDVNHPSILFWDNGNEGGWNRENDGEFDRWDPQRRPVLHPWSMFGGINTDHYENYDSTIRLSAGPDIFMPTEFLHGLYDGGIGAGLQDYWSVMKASSTVAGGFFWAFADEGIARTDRAGKIDNVGNNAPDGFLGARHEKEGSYFAVKEIWSPVQVSSIRLSNGVLAMGIENAYDFSDLSDGTVRWKILRLRPAGSSDSAKLVGEGSLKGPDLSPGERRTWEIPVNLQELSSRELAELSYIDRHGETVWTWTIRGAQPEVTTFSGVVEPVSSNGASVSAGDFELEFDTQSGEVIAIRQGRRTIKMRGPTLAAWLRTPKRRSYTAIASNAILSKLELAPPGHEGVLARATYAGLLKEVVWKVVGNQLSLEYELAHDGPADIFGVRFDVPLEQIQAKRWLGAGPHRVWNNRRVGTQFGLHRTPYSLSIPGETYSYPEFEGFFGEWNWLQMETKVARVLIRNASDIPFFGLYRPAPGEKPVIELPDSGWSLLHAIPAIGTKFDLPEVLGPQSQPTTLDGVVRGKVWISLAKP